MADERKYQRWVFKFNPYDAEAKRVIEYLRKSISPDYSLVLRGRGSRKNGGNKQSIPLDLSEYVAVYIEEHSKRDVLVPKVRVDELLAQPMPQPETVPVPVEQRKKNPAPRPERGGSMTEIFSKLSLSEGEED